MMGKEWDTRSWNRNKLQEAMHTLYSEIENATSVKKRKLAYKMLLHIAKIHEGMLM